VSVAPPKTAGRSPPAAAASASVTANPASDGGAFAAQWEAPALPPI